MFQRHRRWPTEYRVGVQVGSDVRSAVVSDVSENGMNIVCANLPDATGRTIRIKLRSGIVGGTVSWHSGNRMGVRIEPSLTYDALMEMTEGAFRPSRNLPSEVAGGKLKTM